MDVLRRSPKRRDRIEPCNRSRYRRNMGHPSWHHILPDTCRGDAAPGSEISDRLSLIAEAEGQDLKGLSESEQAISAADRVEELVKGLGLSKKLSDYGIRREDLPSIARDASGPEEYSMALRVLEAIF